MAVPAAQEREHGVDAVRRFDRFYTQHVGVLRQGWLDSPFSLTEARVLYEIKQRQAATASDIAGDLGLDAGYLSRILRRFEKRCLIRRQVSPADARQSFLSITAAGRKAFAPLEARTKQQVGEVLERLGAPDQDRLVEAMRVVESLLAATPKAKAMVVLRQPQPGDFGWIVARHAVLYAQEYGWTNPFEGLCAQIVANFVNNFDPEHESCWIAEFDGRNVGCVMLVKDAAAETARLRLLLVDPSARGLGVGMRLTDECVNFARACGYRRITLWTHSILTAACHIYQKAGFRPTSSEPRHSWGQDVVSEHWDLTL